MPDRDSARPEGANIDRRSAESRHNSKVLITAARETIATARELIQESQSRIDRTRTRHNGGCGTDRKTTA